MKKCPWCGQEYPNEISICAIDHSPLESCDPKPVQAVSESQESEVDQVESSVLTQEVEDESAPDGFRSLVALDAFEADRLLKRLSAENIRFEIDRIEQRVSGRTGFHTVGNIKIFVHIDDYEKAYQILIADWKI